MLNSLGNFSSSDHLTFLSSDYGSMTQKRLKVDCDGNVSLYSRESPGDKWKVTWQAVSDPCQIHGVCGPNAVCSYVPGSGRKCSCLPGHRMVNHTDWSYGCEPKFKLKSCTINDSKFIKVSNTDFYGYDYGFFPNRTYSECMDLCLKLCDCKGFQYKFTSSKGYKCYPKTLLLNGFQTPNSSTGDLYLRFPRDYHALHNGKEFTLNCPKQGIDDAVVLNRTYTKSLVSVWLKFFLWFTVGLGAQH